MRNENRFWDILAAHHAAIEENFLDRASLRRIMGTVRPPVLVVGAGQGLLVAELQSKGIQCDGVDFSSEMVRHARNRRGLELIHADATALPMIDAVYETVIYATGVVDFSVDEQAIGTMLREGRRVLRPGGSILVAFYRLSPALEQFLQKVGLLKAGVVLQRLSLETYLLTGPQMVRWVMEKAGTGWLGASALLARLTALGTTREKMTTLKMQRILSKMNDPQAFILAAPEIQPYRNAAEINALFQRLGVPIKGLRTLATCWVAEI